MLSLVQNRINKVLLPKELPSEVILEIPKCPEGQVPITVSTVFNCGYTSIDLVHDCEKAPNTLYSDIGTHEIVFKDVDTKDVLYRTYITVYSK